MNCIPSLLLPNMRLCKAELPGETTKIESSYLPLGGPAHGVLNVGKVILQRLKFAFNLWTISDVVSSSQARKTSTYLVDDGLGGVHAVVVSLEEGLILGLGALLGAGVRLVAVAGLPDESAAVMAEFEDLFFSRLGRFLCSSYFNHPEHNHFSTIIVDIYLKIFKTVNFWSNVLLPL